MHPRVISLLSVTQPLQVRPAPAVGRTECPCRQRVCSLAEKRTPQLRHKVAGCAGGGHVLGRVPRHWRISLTGPGTSVSLYHPVAEHDLCRGYKLVIDIRECLRNYVLLYSEQETLTESSRSATGSYGHSELVIHRIVTRFVHTGVQSQPDA